MTARILIVLGAALVAGGSFLPLISGFGGYIDQADGEFKTFSGGLTLWDISAGGDIALVAVAALAAVLALAGRLRPAALAAAALAGSTVISLIDTLGQGIPTQQLGLWAMPAGGVVALAGAALALRQRSTVAS